MSRSFRALAIALITIATAIPALAHEGHKVMGTVKSIKEKHLEVLTKDGKTVPVMLTDQTKITRGTAAATLADVKVGERVVVVPAMHEGASDHGASHSGMMTAGEVRLAVGSAGESK